MSRHVFLTQFEAASSLDSFDPGVFLNFTFASYFNKMMEIEQNFNVSTAKGLFLNQCTGGTRIFMATLYFLGFSCAEYVIVNDSLIQQ